jgi:hypothetical protein
MNQRGRSIATAIMIAAFGTGLSPASEAWAADADEVQELQKEVRQMRAQVQALVAAISETTELEKQRSANFSRALLQQPSAAAEPGAREPAPATVPMGSSQTGSGAGETKPAVTAPPAGGDDRGRKTPRRRRHRGAGRSRSKDR